MSQSAKPVNLAKCNSPWSACPPALDSAAAQTNRYLYSNLPLIIGLFILIVIQSYCFSKFNGDEGSRAAMIVFAILTWLVIAAVIVLNGIAFGKGITPGTERLKKPRAA